MEKALLLHAMDTIIGGIKVEDQFGGGLVKGADELFDEDPRDGPSRVAIAAGFEPTKGGTARQGRISIDGRLPGRIVTQGVMIIEVFITVGETVDALAQLLELGMFDAFGSPGMASLMAWVSPKRRSIWRRSRIPPALEMSAPPKPASIRRRSKLGKVN